MSNAMMSKQMCAVSQNLQICECSHKHNLKPIADSYVSFNFQTFDNFETNRNQRKLQLTVLRLIEINANLPSTIQCQPHETYCLITNMILHLLKARNAVKGEASLKPGEEHQETYSTFKTNQTN